MKSVLSRAAAEAIPLSRRMNRKGVVYDASHGWCAASWPYVLAAPAFGSGSHRLLIAGEVLDVHYDPHVDPRLCPMAEELMGSHVACRETDPMMGVMVGVGSHLRRDGYVGNFVTTGGAELREHQRRRVASISEVAGQLFAQHFRERGVGFQEMMGEQERLWGRSVYPLVWNISRDLGNAEHVDHDGHRCYAVWVSRHGHASQSQSWWLLFPQHGVAVQLIHGTWISWDGRVQPHATAVPEVAEGDALMSLFTSLPADAMGVLERRLRGGEELRQRSMPREEQAQVRERSGHALFAHLHEGVRVVYRWTPEAPNHFASKRMRMRWGKKHVRWAEGRVISKTETHVQVRDKHGGKAVELSIHEVGNTLMLA